MTAFPLITGRELSEVAPGPGLVLVDFWQVSCAPCRALEPRLEQFHRRHPGDFTGYRIDVDTEQETIATYQVMSIPTIVVLRDGVEVTRLDGLIRDTDLDHALHLARSG
ncbi:thioredoxin [Modestobacter sp. DSM 44400]|uniref:thioredoxin family protein n=1 Tax=Modestobacter sp. DSM 44400 TaxID=1550230 RepID=UPI000897D17D|nr:thioredoxin family protein [Modestobacter sp. DSM 44400]SDY78432.1 thioredoxin [Modestobacter sp. DSM 44400]